MTPVPCLQMTMYAAISIAISLALWAGSAQAACEQIVFEDTPFTVCNANPKTDDIRLFLNGEDGTPLGTFGNVEDALDDIDLRFAMNAGMYHADRRPVGHLPRLRSGKVSWTRPGCHLRFSGPFRRNRAPTSTYCHPGQ